MNELAFGDAELDDLELVREVVLQRLRTDSAWNQLDMQAQGYGAFVFFPEVRHRQRFAVLQTEVMWQLIVQGVISPGMDYSNSSLPFFRITDYGRRVLEERRFVPHDPTGYLEELRSAAPGLDSVTASFLEEALRCFTQGCHAASVLLVGIAAEAALLRACDDVLQLTGDTGAKKRLAPKEPIRAKHRWLVERVRGLAAQQKRQLPESLDMTLGSLGDLIRRQRNELGHPERPFDVPRDVAFVYFRLFPTYLSDIEALREYIRKNGL